MVIVGYLLSGIAWLIDAVLGIFVIVFIAYAVLSWVNPDPRNFIVQIITSLSEPLLSRIRGKIPNWGMLDMSVIVALLGCVFLQKTLVPIISHYANICITSGSVQIVGG